MVATRRNPDTTLAAALNYVARELNVNTHFSPDGYISLNGETPSVLDWRLVATSLRAGFTANLTLGDTIPLKPKNRVNWVFTPHPNGVMDGRIRHGLAQVSRFAGQDDDAATVGAIHELVAMPLVVGRKLTLLEYARLFLETVVPKFREAAAYGFPGQLLMWLGVDIDGYSPAEFDASTSREVARLFMSDTLDWYREQLRALPEFNPYHKVKKRYLLDITFKLEATKTGRRLTGMRSKAYADPEDFIADLTGLLPNAKNKRKSPLSKGSQTMIRRLIRRVKIMGFTSYEFQPRVHADAVKICLGAMVKAFLKKLPLPREKAARRKWLLARLKEPNVSISPLEGMPEVATWIMDVLEGYRQVLRLTGRLRNVVNAGNQSAEDLLAARLLFKWGGFEIDMFPLIEDGNGFEAADEIADAAESTVMVGGSDPIRLRGALGGWVAIADTMWRVRRKKKKVYLGSGDHPLRGGLFPRQEYNTIQGGDAFRGNINAEFAVATLRREAIPTGQVPIVWRKMAERAWRKFSAFVYSPGFTEIYEKRIPLTKMIAVSTRPGSKGSNGVGAAKRGYKYGRAIGIIQLSETILGFFPHLHGSGTPMFKARKALRKLYRKGEWFTTLVVKTLKILLDRVDLHHFATVADGDLNQVQLGALQRDHDDMINAIRYITDEAAWVPTEPPDWVRTARTEIVRLIRIAERTSDENELLGTIMLAMLAWAKTSG